MAKYKVDPSKIDGFDGMTAEELKAEMWSLNQELQSLNTEANTIMAEIQQNLHDLLK